MSRFILIFHLAILALWLATGWLDADPMFITGLALLPYSAKPSRGLGNAARHPHFSWAILAAICLAASFWLPARTLHFFGWGFSGLFTASLFWGKIGPLPSFLLVAMSGLVKNWMLVFSFPIRLKLSEIAAKALTISGLDARADGNLILLDGEPFSVDAACMGLSMIEASLLMYIFLVAFFQKKTALIFGFWKIMAGLPVVLGLNILFNLLRIVALVLGKWPPGSLMHEAVGLFGLLVYVVLPLYFLVKWLAKTDPKFFQKRKKEVEANPISAQNWLFSIKKIQILLAFGLLWVTAFHQKSASKTDWPSLPFDQPGHQMTILAEGVAKYDDGKTLVYVKPIRGFFAAEHTPLICWRGSGFEVAEARIEVVGGREIFTGILKKDAIRLPTAWWYSNGQVETISQAEWRRRDLLGEPPFFLINITVESGTDLREAVVSLQTKPKN